MKHQNIGRRYCCLKATHLYSQSKQGLSACQCFEVSMILYRPLLSVLLDSSLVSGKQILLPGLQQLSTQEFITNHRGRGGIVNSLGISKDLHATTIVFLRNFSRPLDSSPFPVLRNLDVHKNQQLMVWLYVFEHARLVWQNVTKHLLYNIERLLCWRLIVAGLTCGQLFEKIGLYPSPLAMGHQPHARRRGRVKEKVGCSDHSRYLIWARETLEAVCKEDEAMLSIVRRGTNSKQ